MLKKELLRCWDSVKGVMSFLTLEQLVEMSRSRVASLTLMSPAGNWRDGNGVQLFEGDFLRVPVTGNRDYHGDWTVKELLYQNGAWLLSYVRSETGVQLPVGYSRGFFLDEVEYDMKEFVFNPYYPITWEEAVVIGDRYQQPYIIQNAEEEWRLKIEGE